MFTIIPELMVLKVPPRTAAIGLPLALPTMVRTLGMVRTSVR